MKIGLNYTKLVLNYDRPFHLFMLCNKQGKLHILDYKESNEII